jgi:hypothetical protein
MLPTGIALIVTLVGMGNKLNNFGPSFLCRKNSLQTIFMLVKKI